MELLQCTGMKIGEITELCGYKDQYYFSHCFKKLTGVSPNKYRREHEQALKRSRSAQGWNISISGVFIAMVMGIVLTSVVAATLIFVQITGMQWSKCSDKQFPEL